MTNLADAEMEHECKNAPRTNVAPERDFGMLDRLLAQKPNATTLVAEGVVMFTKNDTKCWRDSLTPQKREEVMKIAQVSKPQLLPNDAYASSESTRGYISSKRNDSQHGLNCLYLNTRSLKAFVKTDDNCSKVCKINIFQQLVYCGGYDVDCVCETWLNDGVFDSELYQV